ncbi:peptidase, putative [Plasmodium yoelii]|uniref:Peptidase n=2 Tax=Plasmodium yoelii TaxID=5861 RepID=A0AAE9WZ54_PLAYO|nr:peptidase, putative [Plasmodium yoelii]WBY59048.1 peptidase [Plasmodium yoelii yoelii]CDU19237.1 DnaJ protein, putative [Plasmodium yoelii]VTZ79872.1 peptidase, putative [Plasmodium yoelii]|eukprot:XP_022812569.1 peptidase, putative [Plasmodium yoelii]
MVNFNNVINKCICVFFSNIPKIFYGNEKKKLYKEIIDHVKNSKIINFPIDKDSVNFYFISCEINKLLNTKNKIINDNIQKKKIVEKCFNLYYLLATHTKLKKETFSKKIILKYIEENISKYISKNNDDQKLDEKNIPYSIRIRNDKLVGNLFNELKEDCSKYLKKINNVKVRYLIIDKNEIKIDEKWKKNHEYTFNKNKLKIPISKYNYEYILNGVEDSEIRKKVLELLNSPYKNLNLNNDIINILKKRYDLANKLGYKNWGHYSISQFTMEKNNYENIEKFLNIIKEKIEKDYDKIIYDILKISNSSKFNNKNNKKNYWENNAHKLAIYDWYYYYNKIMNKSDEYLINSYFPQNIVLKNFMEIISRIYNFFYEEIKNEEIKKKWPKDSIIYKIERYQNNVKKGSTINNYENMSNNVFLGYIYIIPYMDINFKDYFKIPSMNSLPNTCLISPGHVLIDYKFIRTVPIKNKLFSSSEILTLFHEFGHAYHLLLLSNNLSLSNLFNIPLDYAEFFSHINEHLANNYDIISILSNKTDNNLKISENLFKTIKFDCSRLSNIYSHSIIDYVIHDINPHLFFSNTINNFEKGKNKEEDNLCNFYEIIERYFPYKFSSFYSIHSTSFPYHFSSCYSGAVLSYLFAEIRVLLNIPTNQINLKKNNTLISFQKKFYDILLNNYRTEDYPSIIANLINSKKSGNFFK